jgi:hypothetical protein
MIISKEDQSFLDNHKFVLYHVGIENQNAYSFANSGFEYELVCHPQNGWAYHVERHKRMIFDSRIAPKYYKTAEEAFSIASGSVRDYEINGYKVNNKINHENRNIRGKNYN